MQVPADFICAVLQDLGQAQCPVQKQWAVPYRQINSLMKSRDGAAVYAPFTLEECGQNCKDNA